MPLKTKRWCDPKEADDGYRLLVCQYRPRALPKEKETWNGWCSELGPSKDLHADYYGKKGPPITFEQFRVRYLEEMEGEKQSEMIDELAALISEGKTITLLCSQACTDPTHCHRTLLKQLIEARVAALQATSV